MESFIPVTMSNTNQDDKEETETPDVTEESDNPKVKNVTRTQQVPEEQEDEEDVRMDISHVTFM